MAINKVVYGNDTLIDLTEDTATANDVLNGKTFHLKNGLRATGNASIGDGSLIIKENATTVETFTANQTTDTTLNLGNLAFYNGDTLASGVDTVSIGIDMDLLWENASPTSDFGAQTLSLDLSSYKGFLLKARAYGDGSKNLMIYFYIDKSSPEWLLSAGFGASGYVVRRYITAISNSGITFDVGKVYQKTNNGACIPVQIYGIK